MERCIIDVEVFGTDMNTGLMEICVHYSDNTFKSMDVSYDVVKAFSTLAEWYNN